MNDFEKQIGYTFSDKKLMTAALTHSSYAYEHHCADNERLEFLGDSVLSIVVTEYLFTNYKNTQEGELTKIRAGLVCEQSLFEISKKINLSQYILLGNGEDLNGGRERPSVMSDAFEALLAAIYLDGGFEKAKAWLLNLIESELKSSSSGKRLGDYKTMLQERTQKGNNGKVTYRMTAESGPDHNKTFESEVLIDGKAVARGKGGSKKEAEQNAAKRALELI